MSRYRFIETQRDHYPVRLLCLLVEAPTSGYYAWQQAQQQAVEQGTPAWETALVKVFGVHKRHYGTRRLQVALRRRGLRALQPKALTPRTTDSTHGLRCAPNRLFD